MKIQSISVAPLAPTFAPTLGALAADPKHDLAFDPKLAASVGVTSAATVTLPKGLVLEAVSGAAPATRASLPAKDVLKLTQSITKVGSLGLDLVQSQFPDLGTAAAIQGTQVVFLSLGAAKAWSEASEKGYTRAVLSTSSAAVELLKLLKPVIPVLNQYGPQIATVSVVLKLADAAYQVKVDVDTMAVDKPGR